MRKSLTERLKCVHSKGLFLVVLGSMVHCTLLAQVLDTTSLKQVHLNQVEISGRRAPSINSDLGRVVTIISREDIAKLPVTCASDLLEYIGNVDVRQRGANGVQADLSFRGGTFDQVMILLNGINITDPQTGHLNLNLPIDLQSIERVEVLQGAGARIFGPNAFSGAVNFITGGSQHDNINASLATGMYGYHNASGNATVTTKGITHFVAMNYGESSGYADNTGFKGGNLFYHGKAKLGNEKLEIQTGYNEKRYGANSFYSAAYPNQYEHTRTYFTSVKLSGGNAIKYNTSAYQRINHDHFELVRDSPKNRNYHLTDVLGVNFNSCYSWIAGKTSFGVDIKNDAIWSNTLGYAMNDTISIPNEEGGMFTKKYSRANASTFLEHSYTIKDFSFSIGVLANWNSGLDWKFRYYPGIDLNYKINNSLSVFANINKALRMPTFTDMFNASGKRYGSDKLNPEESLNYELGLKQFANYGTGSILFYIRDGKNMIDWGSFTTDNGNYYARNIADIMAQGVEVNYNLNCKMLMGENQPLRTFTLAYAYNTQDLKKIPNYSSLYALDYLRYKFTLGVTHRVISSFEATWTYMFEDRNGSYQIDKTKAPINYPAFGLLNGRISWSKPKYKIYCEASNIFNRKYIDIAGVEQPGVWVKVGTSINLNL